MNASQVTQMMSLKDRIRRATEDLLTIQSELDAAASPRTLPSERKRIMEELSDPRLTADLKHAVDHMRHLLWSYMESTSKQRQQDVAQTLQTVRMQRVTEMLRNLEPAVEGQAASTPEATTFFDEIHKIANRALERHKTRSVR